MGTKLLDNLGSMLQVYEDEWAKLLLLFSLYFIIGTTLAIGRNFSEALFVAQIGVEKLPIMFVFNSFVVVIFSLIYAIFADRIKNYRILMYMAWMMSGVLIIIFAAMFFFHTTTGQETPGFLIYILYIAFVAFSILVPSHFATYLQDHYNPLDSKRLVPIILTSSRFGGIIGGVIVSVVASVWDSIYLIIIWVFFLGLAALMTQLIERRHPTFTDVERMTESSYKGYVENLKEGYRYVVGSRFLVVVALSVFAMYFMRNYLDYLNNAMFLERFTDRNDLIAFYGTFSAIADAAAAILQLFVAPRVISKFRVGQAGLIFPLTSVLSMIFIAVALIFVPESARSHSLFWFGVAIFARFNRYSLYPAFNNPVYALFFNAVPAEVRARARGFLTGMVLPIGTCTSGLLMIALVNLPFTMAIITILGILSSALFLYVSKRRSDEYSRALVRLLEEGKFDQLILAEANLGKEYNDVTENLLLNIFRGPDDEMVLFSAQILLEISPQTLRREIPPRILDKSASNKVQKALVGLLNKIEGGDETLREVSREMINDDSEEIRALTIEMLDHYNIEAHELVRPRFQSETARVRGMATVYLLHHGTHADQVDAFNYLMNSLDNGHSGNHLVIFEMMGKTRDRRFLSTLYAHLDPDNEEKTLVILQALHEILQEVKASGEETDKYLNAYSEKEIADIFVASMSLHKSVKISFITVKILILFSNFDSVKRLAPHLGIENYALNDQLVAFMRSRGQAAFDYLVDTYLTMDSVQRLDIGPRTRDTAAICLAPYPQYKDVIADYLRYEIQQVYQRAVDLDIMSHFKTHQYYQSDTVLAEIINSINFFISILQAKSFQATRKVIRILSEMGDREGMDRIKRVLFSPNPRHRAHALETLENVSIPEIVKLLQPLMDHDMPMNEIRKFAEEHFEIKPAEPTQILLRYTSDSDGWIRAMSIEVIGQVIGNNFPPVLFATLDPHGNEIFFRGLGDINEFVREASCVALRRSGHLYEKSWDKLNTLLYKENEPLAVRVQAIQAMVELRRREEPLLPDGVTHKKVWLKMQSTIEKTVALRKVPIFAGLNLEQLKTLSTICTEKMLANGNVLFMENSPGDEMFVILDGKIMIIKDYKKDSQFILTTLKASDPIGEMSVFEDDEKRSATAVAGDETRLLTIKKNELKALIRRYPDISFSIIQGLSRKIRHSNASIQHLEAELNKFKDTTQEPAE